MLLLAYFQLVAWGIVLFLHPTRGSTIFGLVLATVIPIGIGVWAELGARARLKIRGHSTQWNMRTRPNPNLKGSLAPRWTKNAVLIHVDPTKAQMQTNTFLIGTRRPHKLIAALHEATALHGTDTRTVLQL